MADFLLSPGPLLGSFLVGFPLNPGCLIGIPLYSWVVESPIYTLNTHVFVGWFSEAEQGLKHPIVAAQDASLLRCVAAVVLWHVPGGCDMSECDGKK